ncbi:MAG: 30S ribosomal protein S18 [Verrucomicrobia bacterium]|nr:30S ribosomal protein S18 [Verrucomicrobiota bacterium]MBM3870825.1 30S ribosomal protein S18 [Verrucomicrobiota bacterium]
MPRKNTTDKKDAKGRTTERRAPRPKPKIDFTVEAIDYKNVNLLKQFVTDNGRILPRKYTGLPAHYQRRVTTAIKRARQMLLMK